MLTCPCPHCEKLIEIRFVKAGAPRAVAASSGNVGDLLEQIDDDQLEPAAATFVKDTRERFKKYGLTTRMSEKQLGWLERIAAGANRKDDWG